MQGTRLWLPEADRKAASPTESAAMVKGTDREHWGAGCLNPHVVVGRSVGFTLQDHRISGRADRPGVWAEEAAGGLETGGTANQDFVSPRYTCICVYSGAISA